MKALGDPKVVIADAFRPLPACRKFRQWLEKFVHAPSCVLLALSVTLLRCESVSSEWRAQCLVFQPPRERSG